MTAKRAYKQFHIGFSKEEWEIVCRKARAARLRNGTYVRRMAVKGEIKYYELKELVTLKRAFLSIGNNLNQIAKVANESGSVYQKDIEDLQEEFKYFRTAMQSYAVKIYCSEGQLRCHSKAVVSSQYGESSYQAEARWQN